MNRAILLLLLIALPTLAAETPKPAITEKIYDFADLTTEVMKEQMKPKPRPKAAVAGSFSSNEYGWLGLVNVNQMMRNHIEPQWWDDALGTKVTDLSGDRLAVRQTAAVHEKIAAYFGSIRAAAVAPVGTMTPLKNGTPAKTATDRDVRFYTLALDSTGANSDAIQKNIPSESWTDPAIYIEDFGTKTTRVLIVYQSKAIHDQLKAFLAKLPKPAGR